METGLNKAFRGVYNSSKAIIKNNQRHLYCNMLDLLARTTKTTGEKFVNKEEFMTFWITDILPLIFDEDAEIQKSAIAAMETVVGIFNFGALHSSAHWDEIKVKIVQQYSKQISAYRESSNPCWFKIWSILIRILDKEIVKGASTINTFLSIVELGFRSPDYNVRAEAFHCWKVLIEIFANNNEICSTKRIKLICIPLKSSHSKTTQAAVIKFRVWWYFIVRLDTHIEQYVEVILDPFLAFCCSSIDKNTNSLIDFKEMTLLCLISLFGACTRSVKKRMEYFDIENVSGPLINKNIMQKSWKTILSHAMEALSSKCANVACSEFSELLIGYMLIQVFNTEDMEAVSFLLDKTSACGDKTISLNLQKFVCSDDFTAHAPTILSDSFLGKALSALCTFSISNEVNVSLNAGGEIVKNIFEMRSNRIASVIQEFLNETIATAGLSMEGVISTWKTISTALVKGFKKFRCSDASNALSQWIVWPLKAYSVLQCHKFKVFDDQFDCLLQVIVECLNNALQKSDFLKETSLLLQKLYSLATVMHSDLDAYFACFVDVFMSSSSRDKEVITTIFKLLIMNLSKDFNKDRFNLYMRCLKSLVSRLDDVGVETHFENIKDAWSKVINYKRNNHIELATFNDQRKQFLDDVKKVASRTQFQKIKNYLENDDLFVIIPAVWSLNPDKLTERQKEKFYEKSDIPALYNDMSQSQDTFIKPWTPKKLVIAKEHIEEIAIGDQRATEILNPLHEEESKVKSRTSPKKPVTPPASKADTPPSKVFSHSETISPKNKLSCVLGTEEEEEDAGATNKGLNAKSSAVETEKVAANGNLEDYVEQVDSIIMKDTSSPPDRKQTNNSTSPVLKPKTTHLTGRGAQLINMIRNKKHETYNTKQIDTSTPVSKTEVAREKLDTCLHWSGVDSEPKPSPINLLTFSKTLPSPCASPSASILKRKHPNDSFDDVFDVQAYKRKRVSFHDPPVSITKEYLKDDESKNNSKRCLMLEPELKGTTKHLLRRSAKIENQSQIDNLLEVSTASGTPTRKVKCNLMSCEDMGPKMSTEPPSTSAQKSSFPFVFKTESDILSYVVKQFPIEEVLDKYLSDDKLDMPPNTLSKFVSQCIHLNPKCKTTILETLSEKHPQEFLDYAIQENLSSVVCDRLNTNAVIDYICNKSQTNHSCRLRLLQEMQDILNYEKFSNEKWEFIQKTLTSTSLTDQQLLNLIEMLFESKRKHQRAVSESAIDSSSTL